MSAVVQEVTLRFAQNLFDTSLIEWGGSAVAELKMSDGSLEYFGWFHDEVVYKEADFIGKTKEQIREMHFKRDMEYLRS